MVFRRQITLSRQPGDVTVTPAWLFRGVTRSDFTEMLLHVVDGAGGASAGLGGEGGREGELTRAEHSASQKILSGAWRKKVMWIYIYRGYMCC